MIKLRGLNLYLAALERHDCKKICEDNEYDFNNPVEPTLFGWSVEKADWWFDEIQRLLESDVNIRLGIFLNSGEVIGDVALQNICRTNRCCSLGMGIAKIQNRGKGYGTEALALILSYGFGNVGMERMTAGTLEINLPAQKVLERLGFTLEGREREAVYFRGQKYDRLNYGLLVNEWRSKL